MSGAPSFNFSVARDHIFDHIQNLKRLGLPINTTIDPEQGNDPDSNPTLQVDVRPQGTIVYALKPAPVNSADPEDGCFDGRNHLYFSDGMKWIPLSNCPPDEKPEPPTQLGLTHLRYPNKRLVTEEGGIQVPGIFKDPWRGVDGYGQPGFPANESNSYVDFTVPRNGRVHIKFRGYMRQVERHDLLDADRLYLALIITPPGFNVGDTFTQPENTLAKTVFQRSFVNPDLHILNLATMDMQMVIGEWILDSDSIGWAPLSKMRAWVVSKSSDSTILGVQNFEWTYGTGTGTSYVPFEPIFPIPGQQTRNNFPDIVIEADTVPTLNYHNDDP